MIVDSHPNARFLRSKPSWAAVWHVWTVIIPRRSITGRLVYGRVLRRHDGRHWIYKKLMLHDSASCDLNRGNRS